MTTTAGPTGASSGRTPGDLEEEESDMLDWTGGVAEARLTLTGYTADVLKEAHGFGGFLFDVHGQLVEADGWTWLYTTRLVDGRWESWARRFHLASLMAEPARLVLTPQPNRDRAVLHHIVAISSDLYVGFYCDGVGVSAALASTPDGDFVYDASFSLDPSIGWETRGGPVEGWSLESNGAFVPCFEDQSGVVFWQGYDSYRKDGGFGDLGWAKIRVDKRNRKVTLLERHAKNPLKFRRPEWLCARCGGNLDSRVTIDGKRPFFFYMRPARSELRIGLGLSTDPLFFEDVTVVPFDGLYGNESVAEKFEALAVGGELYLFYESMMTDRSWRTGLRTYRLA